MGIEITRNPNDDLLISHPKSTLDMTDEERFKHYVKLKFPKRISDQLLELYPDFDVKYKTALIDLYKDRRIFAFFSGEVGTGKTFSAIIAVVLALKNRWRMLLHEFQLLDMSSFFFELQRNLSNDKYFELIDTMKNCSFLIIDDLGAIKGTEWNTGVITDIVSHRHLNNLSTVITSNLSLKELAENGYIRIISRIDEMCGNDRIIQLNTNLRNIKGLEGRNIS